MKIIYQNGMGMAIVSDAAGGSSNLGIENWLLDLATWVSLVASTRADLEEVLVFKKFLSGEDKV